MTVTYRWEFTPLDVRLAEDGMTNVVYNVNWRLLGTDGDYSANVYGSIGVPTPAPDAFTPYDQLTEETVQGWVEDALGEATLASYKLGIAAQIDAQKNPVAASLPPPWSNT